MIQLVEHAPPKLVGWFRSGHTEHLKNGTRDLPYPASCSAMMDGCKETVHMRCCHWLATSSAFTTKIAAWTTAQANEDRLRRPLVTLRKEYVSETELHLLLKRFGGYFQTLDEENPQYFFQIVRVIWRLKCKGMFSILEVYVTFAPNGLNCLYIWEITYCC